MVCCVECQPTELMIPQSNVMGSGIHHLKGDLRDRTACCLTMSSVTVSMPRRSQDFPLVTTDLDGKKEQDDRFLCFKAFGETLQTQREGTRFDYLKTLLPHSASRCGKRHKSVVLLALSSVFPEDVSVKPASRCEIKGKQCVCLYNPQCAPQAFPTVQISHVCFDFFIIFLYFYMYSVIDFC